MTTQESFNIVFIHLLTQKKKAQSLNSSGVYRSVFLDETGARCAIGALFSEIPVGENSLQDLPNRSAVAAEHPGIFVKDVERDPTSQNIYLTPLGWALMTIHDYRSSETWEESLYALANQHGLEVPILKCTE